MKPGDSQPPAPRPRPDPWKAALSHLPPLLGSAGWSLSPQIPNTDRGKEKWSSAPADSNTKGKGASGSFPSRAVTGPPRLKAGLTNSTGQPRGLQLGQTRWPWMNSADTRKRLLRRQAQGCGPGWSQEPGTNSSERELEKDPEKQPWCTNGSVDCDVPVH